MDNPVAGYSDYHPRWLRHRVSTYWWLGRGSYFKFILREISSAFVAWSVVYVLLVVTAIDRGPAALADHIAWSRQPLVLALNIVSLLLVRFHAITWFNLAPQAMVVHLRGTKVPGLWIAASNYAAWAATTAVIAWLVLGA